jgi:amino acid permease
MGTSIDVPGSALAGYVVADAERKSMQHEKNSGPEEHVYASGDSIDQGSIKIVADNTHRRLRPRHIQLIGIGGTIGTALYVAIGRSLTQGGPGSLFIAFTLWYVIYRHDHLATHVPFGSQSHELTLKSQEHFHRRRHGRCS